MHSTVYILGTGSEAQRLVARQRFSVGRISIRPANRPNLKEKKMIDLVVIGFDDEHTALDLWATLAAVDLSCS